MVLFGYMMYYANPLIVALMFLKLFKKNVYGVAFEERSAMTRFEKRTKEAAICTFLSWKNINGREYPQGLYMGKDFIVYIEGASTENVSATIVAGEKMYAALMAPPEPMNQISTVKVETACSSVEVFMQKGSFKNLYYAKMKLQLDHLKPLPSQKDVLEGILQVYHALGRATIFLYGVTGAGKSSVGYLVAKELHGKYCHTFNPCEPGNQLCTLLSDSDSDATSPLVVVLEEADGLIRRISKEEVHLNNEVPTQVHNKSTWTSFLDDMFLYKNVILIMTSNTSKDAIDAMDPSYLRAGRVHASYCMNEPVVL
jgi:hypothetical protein